MATTAPAAQSQSPLWTRSRLLRRVRSSSIATSLPSQLKAWIDRILVAGKTFRYTETGPEGLATGKRVIVGLARGGFYDANSPAASLEHLESYLQGVFNFIGIEPEFVAADGLAIGPEQREASISQALGETIRLAA